MARGKSTKKLLLMRRGQRYLPELKFITNRILHTGTLLPPS